MELDKRTLKRLLLVVGFGVGLSWLLHNLDFAASGLLFVWSLLRPFIIGIVAAFLLNIPMRAIEKHLFRGKLGRATRPLGFVLTLVLVLGVLTFVVYMVVPQLWQTVQMLGRAMPGYLAQVQLWLRPLEEYIPSLQDVIADLNWSQIGPQIAQFLQSGAGSLFSSAYNFASGFISGTLSAFIGIIFAGYVLLDKEHLIAQLQGLLKAYLPERRYKSIAKTTALVGRTFTQFVTGQCIEALALGSIFAVILLVGRFSYAPLIAVLIGFLSLIPIFGATIACIIGALLILMSQGFVRALVFVIIFLVVQQLDGNLMYPHIVGSTVGLPPIWVLAAITLGGSLMGLSGMLVAIPLASVLYTLLHRDARRRLLKKGVASPVEELGLRQKRQRRKRPATQKAAPAKPLECDEPGDAPPPGEDTE